MPGNIVVKGVEKMRREKKAVKMPMAAKKAGSDIKAGSAIKEPPYHDLPGDPTRTPHG